MAELKVVTKDGLLYYHQKLKAVLDKKVDTKTGYSLVSDTEIERLASVINYDDSTVQAKLLELEGKIDGLEKYDDTEIKGQIEEINSTLETLNTHVSNNDIHVTTEDKTKWNAAEANVITGISVDGTDVTVTEKKAEITINKDLSKYDNATSNFQSDTQVTAAITAAIGDIASFTFQKLEEGQYSEEGVPTLEGAKTNVIYLVPASGGANNVYSEWAYIEESFEMIGNTAIDLSKYVLQTDVITNEDIDGIWSPDV